MESPQKKPHIGFDTPELQETYARDQHELADHPEMLQELEEIQKLRQEKDYHEQESLAFSQKYNEAQSKKSALNAQKVRLNLRLQNPAIDEHLHNQESAAIELSHANKQALLEDIKAQITVQKMLMEEYDDKYLEHLDALKKAHNALHKRGWSDLDELKNINLN